MSLYSYSTVSSHCKHEKIIMQHSLFFKRGNSCFLSELHLSSELGTFDDVYILASFNETGKMIHFQGEM